MSRGTKITYYYDVKIDRQRLFDWVCERGMDIDIDIQASGPLAIHLTILRNWQLERGSSWLFIPVTYCQT
jgi:hypothetical protein